METYAIECFELTKKYRLGKMNELKSFKETVGDCLRNPLSLFKKNQISPSFLALDHVSFSLKQQQACALLGANGSGKSTLLKILSKITYPTSGKAIIKGRVASLLEVGTGFHPELTGRENIFLYGSILGMKRSSIQQKLDAIIAFSELEPFIDTQIKHFSSGMFVRLAFSVAAHLDTDIFFLDEVFAVGDISFQKKCIERIKEFKKEGKSILFVSHNSELARAICEKGLYLEKGRVAAFADFETAVALYEKSHPFSDDESLLSMQGIEIKRKETVSSHESASVSAAFTFDLHEDRELCFVLTLKKEQGLTLFSAASNPLGHFQLFKKGSLRITFSLPKDLFRCGCTRLFLEAFSKDQTPLFSMREGYPVSISEPSQERNSFLSYGVSYPKITCAIDQ